MEGKVKIKRHKNKIEGNVDKVLLILTYYYVIAL
jgi:hypothetical protein